MTREDIANFMMSVAAPRKRVDINRYHVVELATDGTPLTESEWIEWASSEEEILKLYTNRCVENGTHPLTLRITFQWKD